MTSRALDATRVLERMLAEREERNRDNVGRTDSYLELYALGEGTVDELPWLLMAHLVSRNAGYLMTDVAREIERGKSAFRRDALVDMFVFLERANFLIFHDAWHHVVHWLLGRVNALGHETPAFMREAYARHGHRAAGEGERDLVLDLVTNEQNLIENRVVHHPRFDQPRAILDFVEWAGLEQPLVLPLHDGAIRVGGFAGLERRIATGRRIFDEVLSDRGQRRAIHAWACAHPHTGSRAAYGGRAGPKLRDAWPTAAVRGLWAGVHAEPEADAAWP